jgi:hypothetical protein
MKKLVVIAVLLCASLASAFTVFYKSDGDALGRHRILLVIPNEATLAASDINAGISAAQYDGSTQTGQDLFICLHEWSDVRGTGRYYVADDGSVMERSDFVMPQGSLTSLSPLCIPLSALFPEPTTVFAPTEVTTTGR